MWPCRPKASSTMMIVSIRKSYPAMREKSCTRFGAGQAMFTKVVVVVDHDVNVQNFREVAWKTLCAIDPQRDVEFVMGPADTLDHARAFKITLKDGN